MLKSLSVLGQQIEELSHLKELGFIKIYNSIIRSIKSEKFLFEDLDNVLDSIDEEKDTEIYDILFEKIIDVDKTPEQIEILKEKYEFPVDELSHKELSKIRNGGKNGTCN